MHQWQNINILWLIYKNTDHIQIKTNISYDSLPSWIFGFGVLFRHHIKSNEKKYPENKKVEDIRLWRFTGMLSHSPLLLVGKAHFPFPLLYFNLHILSFFLLLSLKILKTTKLDAHHEKNKDVGENLQSTTSPGRNNYFIFSFNQIINTYINIS